MNTRAGVQEGGSLVSARAGTHAQGSRVSETDHECCKGGGSLSSRAGAQEGGSLVSVRVGARA